MLKTILLFLIGRTKLQFVPRRFVIPPKEFRCLYGPEIRQSLIDNFVVNVRGRKQVKIAKKKTKIVQTIIPHYFQCKK